MDQRKTSDSATTKASRQAASRSIDAERFATRFPPHPEPQDDLPRITWEHLQRQLTDLSPCTSEEVAATLRPVRDTASGKPSEMVWRELLIAVSILLDEAPRPDGEGGWTMT